MAYYADALAWVRLILDEETPLTGAGRHIALSRGVDSVPLWVTAAPRLQTWSCDGGGTMSAGALAAGLS
jgi:hypothetical protein